MVYYSPTATFHGTDRLQAFTAIGTVRDGEPYRVDMGGGFHPFRRDVNWDTAEEVPIKPILDQLEFTEGKPNWGYQLRFGLLQIADRDMETIAKAMRARQQASQPTGATQERSLHRISPDPAMHAAMAT